MNLADTAAILKRLATTYGKTVTEDQARSYHLVLGQYHRELAATAAMRVMGESKFMPTPAELQAEVRRVRLENRWSPVPEPFDAVCWWIMFSAGYASPDELTEADIRRANLAAYGVERPGLDRMISSADLAAAMREIISESAA